MWRETIPGVFVIITKAMVLVSGAIRRLDATPDFTYFITHENFVYSHDAQPLEVSMGHKSPNGSLLRWASWEYTKFLHVIK